jgi:hypothetical protein
MPSNTAKTPSVPTSTLAKSTPAGASQQQDAKQDSKLVAFVRGNSKLISAGLLGMAAKCGQERDWDGMHEYQTLAGQLTTLAGAGQPSGSQQPATMAAAAGR